uniref:NADH-ubiquinone oxidoreductase chain 2 n=1 Tax=Azumapecten farreri TaxID=106299 RepID=C4NTL7_AZUFA|nr:NADH dehydrogenase subunit 2 [Azumapecten farreri]ABQ96660.1 NADH dehydrogenase subunit 2 [Azumapecten farreri]ACL36022.1 NADH dehydrogenase subunit 2 [Azumapecten farreri]
MRNFSYAWCLILTSMLFSMVSPGWLGVWVGLEMNLFGALLFLVNNKKQTVTSGYKYFYIQSLGSSVMVMSIVAGGWTGDEVSASGLLCGMGVKLGAVPFHFWVVEVLDGMRPGCMWFVLTVQKLVPLCCVCQGFCSSLLLAVLSGSSAVVGSISGAGSTRVSRFVGYSSVAHTGWSLASCYGGLWVLAYYLLAYWTSLGGFLWLMGGDGYLYSMSGGAVRRHPFSWGICIWLLSLGGFPPFPGFCGKFVVLVHVIKWMPALAVFLVASSVTSWSYYIFVMSLSVIRGSKCTKSNWSGRSMVFPILLSVPYLSFLEFMF